jgi:hypothetical protein
VDKIAGHCLHECAELRNFAHAIASLAAWATRRYAMPRVQRRGDGALPTLQTAPM